MIFLLCSSEEIEKREEEIKKMRDKGEEKKIRRRRGKRKFQEN